MSNQAMTAHGSDVYLTYSPSELLWVAVPDRTVYVVAGQRSLRESLSVQHL